MSSGPRPPETALTCADAQWLGIDFSGNHKKWSRACRNSNVWIATVQRHQGALTLIDLRRVQALGNDVAQNPFERLASHLRSKSCVGIGIDAPFSIPSKFMSDNHQALVALIDQIHCPGRPFPDGKQFVKTVAHQHLPLSPPKPLRETERFWSSSGINIRSTLWTGARPGAPMTAACLKLLALSGRPIWPWTAGTDALDQGLLVEAFPAAQLRQWGAPHQRYDGKQGTQTRGVIVDHLKKLVSLNKFEADLRESADATDAVICAFAPKAVTDRQLAQAPGPNASDEGFIAVHQ